MKESKQIKNFKEFSQALNDGETLIDRKSKVRIFLNKNGDVEDKDGFAFTKALTITDFTGWSIYEKPKWYENIPEYGVLCWVHDSINHKNDVQIIVRYNPLNTYKFVTKIEGEYICATPLTREELDSFNVGIGE